MRCVELHPVINVVLISIAAGDKYVPSYLQNEYSKLSCVLVFQVGGVRKEKINVFRPM